MNPSLQELHQLRERIKELEDAARRVIDNGPCCDPDCCETALMCTEARDNLERVLNYEPPP